MEAICYSVNCTFKCKTVQRNIKRWKRACSFSKYSRQNRFQWAQMPLQTLEVCLNQYNASGGLPLSFVVVISVPSTKSIFAYFTSFTFSKRNAWGHLYLHLFSPMHSEITYYNKNACKPMPGNLKNRLCDSLPMLSELLNSDI